MTPRGAFFRVRGVENPKLKAVVDLSKRGRSEGSKRLAKLGQTQEVLAKKIGVSRVAVAQYLAGDSKPGAERRAKIAEMFGISPELWDKPPTNSALARHKPEESKLVPPTPTASKYPDVIEQVIHLQGIVYNVMLRAEEDVQCTPHEQAKTLSSLAQTYAIVTKILGQDNLGEKIKKLPIWKEIESAFQRGLVGHPEAAKSVAAELRKQDEENSP